MAKRGPSYLAVTPFAARGLPEGSPWVVSLGGLLGGARPGGSPWGISMDAWGLPSSAGGCVGRRGQRGAAPPEARRPRNDSLPPWKKNFTIKLPRTTLGTGLARTGTNAYWKKKSQSGIRPEPNQYFGTRVAYSRHSSLDPAGGRHSSAGRGVRGVSSSRSRCATEFFRHTCV